MPESPDLYRERDDRTRDRELADSQAVGAPGQAHRGETRVDGLERVFEDGALVEPSDGGWWDSETQQATLTDMGGDA
jgi:hypothetical protein